MEHFQGTSLVGCGLLLLTMGITPGALLGQTTERTGTHFTTIHKQFCTSCSFYFCSDSHNACCARIA